MKASFLLLRCEILLVIWVAIDDRMLSNGLRALSTVCGRLLPLDEQQNQDWTRERRSEKWPPRPRRIADGVHIEYFRGQG
uniref:Secreted protein n=1 Tax=Ascaris lumbricoides TaxID=6252 RepID=A0A0M3I3Y7_ASCLU